MNPETRFYQPLKNYFSHFGFEVKGEVQNCDLVALREEQLVVVEFKNRLSLKLLLQAVDRLALTDWVYIAVPVPKRRNRQWRQVKRLCGLLALGLITVDFSSSPPLVVLERDAAPGAIPRSRKRQRSLLDEFFARQGDPNQGGSVGRRKLLTAYRQCALAVARLLLDGPQPLSALKMQAGKRVPGILQKNHYGWFRRIERGVYELTDLGRQAVEKYSDGK